MIRTIVLLLASTLTLTANASANDSGQQTWLGFFSYEGRQIRAEITINDFSSENPGFMHLPDIGLVYVPVIQATLEDGHVELITGLGQATGSLAENGATLKLNFVQAPGQPELVLIKNNPAFDKFRVPRLDQNLEPVRQYAYKKPELMDDGWATGAANDLNISRPDIEKLVTRILKAEEGLINTLLIARGGKLILDEYFYGHDRDQIHTIQSITKSVTSLIFGGVMQSHKIDIGSTIHGLFPEHKNKRWIVDKYDISIEQLLTMSAGLDWNEELPYTDPRNSNTAMNASPSWVGYVLDRPRLTEAGINSSYTSGLSILLGEVLHKITGNYVDEIARSGLFADLGIDEFSWTGHADGTKHTGGGLSLRARDLAKLGQLVLDEGRWQGRQLLPAEWINASTIRQLPLKGDINNPGVGYGYQWWIMNFETDRPFHCIAGLGYGGQFLGIFPELDLVLVMNAEEFVPGPNYDMSRIVTSVLKAVDLE